MSKKRRTLKQKLERTIRRLRKEKEAALAEADMLRREADTTKRQMLHTVSVNHYNAAAHRATEVALLRTQNQLDSALSLRSSRDKDVGAVPAMCLPKPIDVNQPLAEQIKKLPSL